MGTRTTLWPGSGNPKLPPLAHHRVAKVLAWAKSQEDDSYRMGATGPDTWNCSSFTERAYAQIGIKLTHRGRPGALAGRGKRDAHLTRLGTPGDLLFWDSYLGPNQIGHVMLVWNPAAKTTIEAHNQRAGVGHFSYLNGSRHRIFEIWRIGNID